MMNTTISKTYFFAASRETVWSFLTEKDKLAQWFHHAKSDLVEGENYSLFGLSDDGRESKKCWGTVLKMDKPSRLVYSFTIEPLNGAETTVTWTLEEISGGTKLTLNHEGISEAAGDAALALLMGLDGGWDEHVTSLRSLINKGLVYDCEDPG